MKGLSVEEALWASRHTNLEEWTSVEVSGRRVGCGMRRGSAAVGFVFQMLEDFSDDTRLDDEGNHAQLAATGTQKWVELENPSDQICPPSTQSLFSGGAEDWLLFLSLVSRRNGLVGELKNPPASSNYVGIVPIVEEQMSPRLW